MRIALVSDIHGNLAALEAVVADIQHRGVDEIVCLGDNISGPLLQSDLRDQVRVRLSGKHRVPVGAGNTLFVLHWRAGKLIRRRLG